MFVCAVISAGILLSTHKDKAHASSGITSLEAALVWSDNVEPHMGQSATVVLYENGSAISTVEFSINNCWQCKWEGLNPNANYDVQEITGFSGYYTQYH